jgi:cytochrome c-type biogenesis protein CcmH/NrfG
MSAAAPPETVPARVEGPRPEDATRDQVRALLDRAREKMEARNPEAARADFEAVLRLDPNNFVARDALERLRNRPPGPPGRPGPGPRPTP